VRSRAVGAILAQGAQAGISFVLQVLVARTLGIEELGRFAILYGVIVIVTGVVTGVVGDSLVVLDRAHAPIRSALQGTTLVLATAGGLIGAVTFLLVGLVTPIEALLFAGATALFTTEEVLRRLLMAHFAFYRVIAADLGGFAVALAIVLAAGAASASSLAVFLGAICAGQAVAIVLAVVLLPRHERRWAPAERGGLQEVLGYGTWRGLQQLLRPGLLTAVRLLVGVFAGLAAVGLLEAARVYVAPALLVVGGLTSFLFVRYAQDRGQPVRAVLRRADLTVLALVGGTAVMGVIAVLLLPWAGPLLFTVQPPTDAVMGWLAFTAAVAATTPYGTLAAVHGGQRRVFALRLTDTILSVVGVLVLLLTAGDVVWVPIVLAAGALLGGLAIRFLVLVPLTRRPSTDADGPSEPSPYS
jgi:O-antigen/teichoic acid export membrane protein